MLTTVLKTLFNRDLNKLKAELELYRNEKNIWLVEKNIANTAGNLCLHLVGNLNAYLGVEIGGTGYVRNGDFEFSLKDIPRAELISMVESTITVVNNALDLVTEEDLQKEYPLLVLPQKTSTEYFLVHLAAHLGYHLGQINYHRRLLDK